jgi:hypothetical protein
MREGNTPDARDTSFLHSSENGRKGQGSTENILFEVSMRFRVEIISSLKKHLPLFSDSVGSKKVFFADRGSSERLKMNTRHVFTEHTLFTKM